MMSLEVLRAVNAEAVKKALGDNKEPYVPSDEDLEDWREQGGGIKIPDLGDYVPKGWEICDRETWFFVDATGIGESGEAALTVDEFLAELTDMRAANPTLGYGIVEKGQFQLYIAPFRPK